MLVLERKRFDEIELERAARQKNPYNVFMALANHVGHDKRGNPTYVRDEHGNAVVTTKKERVKEVVDGTDTFRSVETASNLIDDNTSRIAEAFRVWLKEQI